MPPKLELIKSSMPLPVILPTAQSAAPKAQASGNRPMLSFERVKTISSVSASTLKRINNAVLYVKLEIKI